MKKRTKKMAGGGLGGMTAGLPYAPAVAGKSGKQMPTKASPRAARAVGSGQQRRNPPVPSLTGSTEPAPSPLPMPAPTDPMPQTIAPPAPRMMKKGGSTGKGRGHGCEMKGNKGGYR